MSVMCAAGMEKLSLLVSMPAMSLPRTLFQDSRSVSEQGDRPQSFYLIEGFESAISPLIYTIEEREVATATIVATDIEVNLHRKSHL